MLTVYVQGIGMVGPGLDGWQQGRPVLAGEFRYTRSDYVPPLPPLLPAAERRRTSITVRLAMRAAQEALAQHGTANGDLAAVFASADGDTEVLHQLCSALAQPEKAVSPTCFHNSVHNAPSGYWSIATGSHAGSDSVACHDQTFAAGLLDAASQVAVEGHPALLSAYDMAMPQPLYAVRPLGASFAAALLLDARPSAGSLARLDIELDFAEAEESTLADQELEALRRANPAARCLPLLAAIAHGRGGEVVLQYLGGSCVRVRVDR